MPTYDYKCRKCHHMFWEIVPSSTREEDVDCPNCSGKATGVRQVSAHSIRGPLFGFHAEIKRKHPTSLISNEEGEHEHMLATRTIDARPGPKGTRPYTCVPRRKRD